MKTKGSRPEPFKDARGGAAGTDGRKDTRGSKDP